jgi:hypothetical protein
MSALTSRPRRFWGRPVPVRALLRKLLWSIEGDYLISRTGQGAAVVQLLGGDYALVEAKLLEGRLRALQRYLDESNTPMMRISSSRPQPLDRYAATLEPMIAQQRETAPHLAERLQDVLATMSDLAEQGQARIGVDYWVMTYQPGLSEWRPGQGRAVSRAQMRAGLDEQVARLLSALSRAGIQARRVVGTELAALSASAWQRPEAPLALPPLEVDLDTLQAWITDPDETLLVAGDTIQASSGFVRSWYLQDFRGSLAAGLLLSLAHEPGMRVLQFWERVPPEQIKQTMKQNRVIEASLHYLRPGGVRDYDDEARQLALEQQAARASFNKEQIYRYRALIQLWDTDLSRLEQRARVLEKVVFKDKGLVASTSPTQDQALASGQPVATCLAPVPERNLNGPSLPYLVYPGPRDPLSKSGFWLGSTIPDGLLVTLDVHQALRTPVVFLVGQMGSGKSVALKSCLTQAASQGLPAIVIDAAPQAHEYTRPVEALGGIVVPLGQAGGVSFNPVYFDPASHADPFVQGQSVFLDWFEIAVRPFSEHGIERTVLERAYQRALATAKLFSDDRTSWTRPTPLLEDIQAALYAEMGREASRDVLKGTKEDPQFVAHTLAFLLEPFVSGYYAPLFNRPTTLPPEKAQVVCFDLADVPDRLRLPCFHLVTTYTGGAILDRWRFQRPVVFVDEGYQLLEDPRGARPVELWIRNARKASAGLFLSAHTAADSQLNRSAQLAQATAGATLLFHIEAQDEATVKAYRLSEAETALVTRPDFEPGDCLLIAPSGRIPLHIDFPPTWYNDFTTRPDEVVALAEAERHLGDDPVVAAPLPVAASASD